MQCIDEITKFDINKCLNNQKKITTLKIKMNWTLSMIWHGSSDHVGSLRRAEFNLIGINHILNLVFQCPTIVSIMPWAVGMVCTPCIRIVVRGRSLKIQMRSYQRNQIHP